MPRTISIVGMQFLDAETLTHSLPVGEPLTVVRDRDNKYDRNAVEVWARGTHIGFLKRGERLNDPVARMMDRHKIDEMPATLARDPTRWPQAEIADDAVEQSLQTRGKTSP